MKKVLILLIAMISFSGFSATFNTDDVSDKMEMVVDVGVQSVDAILVSDAAFLGTSISADANIDFMVYSTASGTAKIENVTTLAPIDDVGWLMSITSNYKQPNVNKLYNRTDHRISSLQETSYQSLSKSTLKERFMFNSFSC